MNPDEVKNDGVMPEGMPAEGMPVAPETPTTPVEGAPAEEAQA